MWDAAKSVILRRFRRLLRHSVGPLRRAADLPGQGDTWRIAPPHPPAAEDQIGKRKAMSQLALLTKSLSGIS